jgi:Tfp pilus assembly protein PilO
MRKSSNWAVKWKEPRMLMRAGIGVLMAANLAMAVVAFKPFGGSADDLRKEEQMLRNQLAAMQARLGISRRMAAKVETAREQGDQFLVKYVVARRTASSAVYEELTRMATEAGVQPQTGTFQYEAIDGSDTLQMMVISAGFEGTYQQITKFLNLVDKSPRFLVIESMQTAAPGQNSRNAEQKLPVQFTIKTFVRSGGEEAAAEQLGAPEPVARAEEPGGAGERP